ncbi:MAG: helix-turn-helix domain-containing protein [Rhodobacteraceae bacterium]|nr:helix-turn-helix domain-containing protein [Paracoccaceae bacterium]
MLHTDPNVANSLGADLRALRKVRGLSLADLAASLGRSVGWLSQVERDLSEPSVADLRKIAGKLDVSLSMLFGQASAPVDEQGFVVRREARRPIGEAGGLVEELLSPDLTDEFEMLHSTFQPGAELTTPTRRPTQEVGYLISGKLDLWIGARAFTIHPGDSFRIRGEPYRWANPYSEPAVAIWVVAPPVY